MRPLAVLGSFVSQWSFTFIARCVLRLKSVCSLEEKLSDEFVLRLRKTSRTRDRQRIKDEIIVFAYWSSTEFFFFYNTFELSTEHAILLRDVHPRQRVFSGIIFPWLFLRISDYNRFCLKIFRRPYRVNNIRNLASGFLRKLWLRPCYTFPLVVDGDYYRWIFIIKSARHRNENVISTRTSPPSGYNLIY